MPVPLMNTRAQYEPLIDQVRERVLSIIDGGRFILGEHVTAFEQEAAAYLGVRHCIGVGNGTDALSIALRALGIGPGDEVICPAYTFYATPESISAVGARPVFADVDETCTLDPESVRSVISGATKAIMPVHLFGLAADMDALQEIADEHGLAIVEDAAQAFGSTWQGRRCGSLGDAATFSFFPTKNLGGFGDGGLVATDRDDVAELARMLRFHGSKDKQVFHHIGYNSRLDEIQAGVLRLLLPELDGWNAARRGIADHYRQAGLGELVELPPTPAGREHTYHLHVVRSDDRDGLVEQLREQGIGATVYYGNPHHLQPVYADLGYTPGDLPVTEQLAAEGVALPIYPTMTTAEADEVVAAVRAARPAIAGA